MGTALVMEHANALAQMIVSEKDKLFDERVEALVKLYRRGVPARMCSGVTSGPAA